MREELTHLLLHLFDSEILTGVPVYLIGELSAVVNHLLHCHILNELTVLVAVDTVIFIGCAIRICAEDFVGERHSAALTIFHIHIVSNVLSVFHYLFKILTPPIEQRAHVGAAVAKHSDSPQFNENS